MSEPDGKLADGASPSSPAELFRRFETLGIAVTTVDHPAVFTVDEAKVLRGTITGRHTKNLFLRNKKGRMWLVVCAADREIHLQILAARLGAGRFSFGSPDRLMKFLGVTPGAVTPFAVVNDTGGQVRVVLDEALLTGDVLNFHPLVNTKTTSIGPDDLVCFLASENHTAEIVELASRVRS